MREILFRGKKPITENWVYGTGLLFDGINTWVVGNSSHKPIAFGEEHYCVIPKTVGQFTGLTDKNSKKIFEGDIVQFEKYATEISNNVYAVKYDAEIATFIGVKYSEIYETSFTTFDDDSEFIEVIGNIHDNPELLGGEG